MNSQVDLVERWTHPVKDNPSKKCLAKRRSREAKRLREAAASAQPIPPSSSSQDPIDNFRPSGAIEDSDDDAVPPPPDPNPAPCPVRRRMRGKQHPNFGW